MNRPYIFCARWNNDFRKKVLKKEKNKSHFNYSFATIFSHIDVTTFWHAFDHVRWFHTKAYKSCKQCATCSFHISHENCRKPKLYESLNWSQIIRKSHKSPQYENLIFWDVQILKFNLPKVWCLQGRNKWTSKQNQLIMTWIHHIWNLFIVCMCVSNICRTAGKYTLVNFVANGQFQLAQKKYVLFQLKI